jgi:hypothetical protein
LNLRADCDAAIIAVCAHVFHISLIAYYSLRIIFDTYRLKFNILVEIIILDFTSIIIFLHEYFSRSEGGQLLQAKEF